MAKNVNSFIFSESDAFDNIQQCWSGWIILLFCSLKTVSGTMQEFALYHGWSCSLLQMKEHQQWWLMTRRLLIRLINVLMTRWKQPMHLHFYFCLQWASVFPLMNHQQAVNQWWWTVFSLYTDQNSNELTNCYHQVICAQIIIFIGLSHESTAAATMPPAPH